MQNVASQDQAGSTGCVGSWRFTVRLRRGDGGPELVRETMGAADLQDAFGELWLDAFLRRGCPDVPLERAEVELTPRFRPGQGARCTGFELEATNSRGERMRKEFSLRGFDEIAGRHVQQFVAQGVLGENDSYEFDVVAERQPCEVNEPGTPFEMTATSSPLSYVTAPLRPLLKRARPVGSSDQEWMPVFYVEPALARAEQFARKGADRQPPVESGAALVGVLGVCPESGEMYSVVTEAYEAVDADGTQFSLAYTGRSWSRIQAILNMKRREPGGEALRLLGQAHGHNWLPLGGAPPCDICQPGLCTRTTVFVSVDDRTWTRATFPRSPWVLCHIFGFNARKERVEGLFGLRDNRLQPRGYYVIPEFDPVSKGARHARREDHNQESPARAAR